MQVVTGGVDETWLNSPLLHFKCSVQLNRERGEKKILGVDKCFSCSYNETFSSEDKDFITLTAP